MELTGLFLFSVLIGGALSTPVRDRETADENTRLDLLFDPEPVKEHFTFDDYGARPVPPRVPSYLLRARSPAGPVTRRHTRVLTNEPGSEDEIRNK